jgi:dihydrofolate synthase / folylpolyglutamate synthase
VYSIIEEFGEDLAAYPTTNLEGDYQRWNAATATLVARALPASWGLADAVLARGLHAVGWPGRWQRTQLGGRPLILDASHNPEGAEMLEANLQHLKRELATPPVVIVGVLGAARARPLLDTICRHAREIHFVVPQQARACSHEELEALVPKEFRGRTYRATVENLFPNASTCTAGGPHDTVVVTGSIYLLGEVLARLEPQRGKGEGRLQDF